MKKLIFTVLFLSLISCDRKPDNSKFDAQIKEIKDMALSLEQDLIKANTQTKRAIGLAEHFRDLYYKEREKVDSLKIVLKGK